MPILGSLLHFGYAPLLLIGINGAAIHAIATEDRPWLPALLLVGAVVVSFGAERVVPYNIEWNHSHGDRSRDFVHAIVNEASAWAGLLLLPLVTSFTANAGTWPSSWPFVLQVVLGVVVLDAGVTLAHFASHRWSFLWRFHAVHHSVRRMYGLNGLMKHPIHQTIETMAGTVPLIAIGLPTDVALALVFLVATQLLLQHSNVDYTLGPLRTWIATNEVHRFHHQSDPDRGDVNFGLFSTIWDRLLGTFHYEQRARFETSELGIADRPNYPAAYVAQLIEPFRRGLSGTATPLYSSEEMSPSSSIVEAPRIADGETPNI